MQDPFFSSDMRFLILRIVTLKNVSRLCIREDASDEFQKIAIFFLLSKALLPTLGES